MRVILEKIYELLVRTTKLPIIMVVRKAGVPLYTLTFIFCPYIRQNFDINYMYSQIPVVMYLL